MQDFDEVVLNEGGFTIELSNHGVKPKFNPNPQNLERNDVSCKFPGCDKRTRTMFGLCTEHNDGKGKREIKHTKDWIGRIIPPGHDREDCMTDAPAHYMITEILIKWMKEDVGREETMDGFINDCLESIVGNIPDATSLQKSLDGDLENIMTLNELVDLTRRKIRPSKT